MYLLTRPCPASQALCSCELKLTSSACTQTQSSKKGPLSNPLCSDCTGPRRATNHWIGAARKHLIHDLVQQSECQDTKLLGVMHTSPHSQSPPKSSAAQLQRSRLPKLRLEQQSSTSVQRLSVAQRKRLRRGGKKLQNLPASWLLREPRKPATGRDSLDSRNDV